MFVWRFSFLKRFYLTALCIGTYICALCGEHSPRSHMTCYDFCKISYLISCYQLLLILHNTPYFKFKGIMCYYSQKFSYPFDIPNASFSSSSMKSFSCSSESISLQIVLGLSQNRYVSKINRLNSTEEFPHNNRVQQLGKTRNDLDYVVLKRKGRVYPFSVFTHPYKTDQIHTVQLSSGQACERIELL